MYMYIQRSIESLSEWVGTALRGGSPKTPGALLPPKFLFWAAACGVGSGALSRLRAFPSKMHDTNTT